MEIKKLIEGYEIKVSHDEFDMLVSALDDAISWAEGFGFNTKDFCDLHKELKAVKKRFLTDDETQGIRNCLVCRHCLPPIRRENGKMCSLNECKFEEAKPTSKDDDGIETSEEYIARMKKKYNL